MMLPDLQRTAEIELLSYGYTDAKSLGTKIVTMFQLCRAQLIAQPHYDFGMRTLKIVLEMCERAKVQFPTKPEESIAVEIIRQTIFCMLDDEDVNIFEVCIMHTWILYTIQVNEVVLRVCKINFSLRTHTKAICFGCNDDKILTQFTFYEVYFK